MKTKLFATATAIAAFVSIGASSGWAAEAHGVSAELLPTTITRSVVVRYENGPEDRETLRARLEAAAKNVCGSYDVRNLAERSQWRACYSAALATAAERVQLAAR
jgi:UrcA family protein